MQSKSKSNAYVLLCLQLGWWYLRSLRVFPLHLLPTCGIHPIHFLKTLSLPWTQLKLIWGTIKTALYWNTTGNCLTLRRYVRKQFHKGQQNNLSMDEHYRCHWYFNKFQLHDLLAVLNDARHMTELTKTGPIYKNPWQYQCFELDWLIFTPRYTNRKRNRPTNCNV